MTPEECRAYADACTPRVLADGYTINAQHVAIESTLRRKHGHPSYIADLDGPGRYRPTPPMTFRLDETVTYDRELGEVRVSVDEQIREVMRVRAALVDEVLLAAIVVELERRGYSVTAPAVTE